MKQAQNASESSPDILKGQVFVEKLTKSLVMFIMAIPSWNSIRYDKSTYVSKK